MKLLPIMLDLWDSEALYYKHDLPDGFVSKWKVKDTSEPRVHVDTTEKELTFAYRHTVNSPLEKAAKIPANLVQAVDGYIVRELTARCDHNKIQLMTAEVELINRLKKNVEPPLTYIYSEQMWRKHECISIEGVNYVNNWSVYQMSSEYCLELLKLIRETLSKPTFKVLHVHDMFKCLPNYMGYVRNVYRDILGELADSRILNAILTDISGYEINIPKMSTDLSDSIKDSTYSLS